MCQQFDRITCGGAMRDNWIKRRRTELDLNQDDLAARLEIAGFSATRGSISHWENERYQPPLDDPNFRQAMAKALKLNVPEMLAMAGYEVRINPQSDAAKRGAAIIDRLPEDARNLALDYLLMLERRYVE